ncbi:MAG TPA: hypothetical protein DDY37_04115 [Legionella sp.]|nr:hypothetical protein [Legionella sp.]
MPVKTYARQVAYVGLLSLVLIGCSNKARFHPPFNDFRPPSHPLKRTTAAVGGYVGVGVGLESIVKDLNKNDIEYVRYGDTVTLIVPTDHYFEFNSPLLNDICYEGLNNIVKLLNLYPCSDIYVAAFTDNVGSRYHKKRLTDAQAETMLTFLWANDIRAHRLKGQGFGDSHPIADNQLIHGSAHNRRIEIQWVDAPPPPKQEAPHSDGMK